MLSQIKTTLFRRPESKPRTVTATASAATRVRNSAGEWVTLAAGETAEVLETDAAASANITYTRKRDPDEPTPRDLVPAPREAKPMPSSWADLPKCFARYYELSERLAIAIDHVLEIRAALRQHFPAACPDDVASISYARWDGEAYTPGKAWASGRNIDLGPTARREFDLLDRAEREAWQTASDLRDRTQEPLAEAYLACARHRMRMHGDRAMVTRELNETAYDLFAGRIAAMGLHQNEVRRMFRGSRDFLAYYRELPVVRGLKRLGPNDSVVIDSVDALAAFAIQDAAATSELADLLAEAKRELKRAAKVA